MFDILKLFFGKGAIKAVAGGIGAAGAVVGSSFVGACDLETIAQQAWAGIGAFVIGHAFTWLSPRNK